MFEGKRYFRELLQSEERIASNILSDRLAMLEREEIISKTADPEHKQKNIYRLTEKGIDLLPVMVEIGSWSIKHKPVDLKKHQHAKDLVKSGKEGLVEMRKRLVNEHLKKVVDFNFMLMFSRILQLTHMRHVKQASSVRRQT